MAEDFVEIVRDAMGVLAPLVQLLNEMLVPTPRDDSDDDEEEEGDEEEPPGLEEV